VRLTLFQLGRLDPVGIPIPGYLVQTDDGTNVLVDSGFPRGYMDSAPGPIGPLALQPHVRPEDHIVERLRSVGLEPGAIHLLVCTHFDTDHAGNHHLFTSAELIVQRRHHEVASQGHPRFAEVRESWDAPDLRYRLVDGDTTLLPGLELIETSGHVPGHQSVLVELPRAGPVLLAIDALPSASCVDADTRPIYPNDEDEVLTRRSTGKLADLVRDRGVALTVYGHDPSQWPQLRLAPEWYA